MYFSTLKLYKTREHSYLLRRKDAFYYHVLEEKAGVDQVKSLFLSDFHAKVLDVVAFTPIDLSKDSYLMWTKLPCDSLPPKLANIWTRNLGFRKDQIFEQNMLNNLSCRLIEGATQHWPPFSYITENPGKD